MARGPGWRCIPTPPRPYQSRRAVGVPSATVVTAIASALLHNRPPARAAGITLGFRYVSKGSDHPSEGGPPPASREDVLDAAMHRYLRGRRVDVQAIAAELGLGRTTMYRWFGSREDLIGEVLVRAADPLLDAARAGPGAGRPRAARHLRPPQPQPRRRAGPAPVRRAGARARAAIITSGAGVVQPRIVARIARLIEEEVAPAPTSRRSRPATLGYAIVRLAEAFLFNDAAAGMRGDVDRLRDVEAAILGVPA